PALRPTAMTTEAGAHELVYKRYIGVSRIGNVPWVAPSNAFERQRDALPDADAQGGEAEPAVALLQAVQCGERQSRTRHSERMAERDGAAMRVHVLGIVGKAELAQAA